MFLSDWDPSLVAEEFQDCLAVLRYSRISCRMVDPKRSDDVQMGIPFGAAWQIFAERLESLEVPRQAVYTLLVVSARVQFLYFDVKQSFAGARREGITISVALSWSILSKVEIENGVLGLLPEAMCDINFGDILIP
jgi:hypothetical protein